MTGMDVLSLVIGLVWGTLATWGFAVIILRETRVITRDLPTTGIYLRRTIVIERSARRELMLEDGKDRATHQ